MALLNYFPARQLTYSDRLAPMGLHSPSRCFAPGGPSRITVQVFCDALALQDIRTAEPSARTQVRFPSAP